MRPGRTALCHTQIQRAAGIRKYRSGEKLFSAQKVKLNCIFTIGLTSVGSHRLMRSRDWGGVLQMKRTSVETIVIKVLLVATIFTLFGWHSPVLADPDEQYLPNEVVIKLRSPRDLYFIAKRFRLSPAPLERFGRRPIYRMQIMDGTDPEVISQRLVNESFGRVEFAEPNYQLQAPEARGNSWSIGGNEPQYINQWFRAPLRIDDAHTASLGLGTTIAVLDTGIDLNHPSFAGRLVPGYDFVDGDAIPQEEGVFGVNPGFGHGTHVAGLALLVAPQANVMPIRVLDPNGVGNIWVLAEALQYAADPDGDPKTPDGVDVINLSLATRRQTDLLRFILEEIGCSEKDDLIDSGSTAQCAVPGQRGIVVVAGSGNRAIDIPEYPAAEPLNAIISVAGTNQTDVLASFSNYGSWISVAAPGQSILSTVPGGAFGTWSGTSMSTPLAAGAAALILSQNPDWTNLQVKERMISSGVTITGKNPPFSRLDIGACVGQ